MRGKPPYTVYPYSAKDVVQLMMGNLYLHTVVYLDRLKEAFLDYGWAMDIDIPDDLEHNTDGQVFGGEELFVDMNDKELFITFTHLESGFLIKIGMELINKIGLEFLSAESCLPSLEARRKQVIKAGRSTSEFMYAINDSEEKVWK